MKNKGDSNTRAANQGSRNRPGCVAFATGRGGAGRREISSCCSERDAVLDLRVVYFWTFPFNVSGPWLTANN